LHVSLRQTREARLLSVSILFLSWLPTVGLADDVAAARTKDVQEMISASVKMETGLDAIDAAVGNKVRAMLANSDRESPAVIAEMRNHILCLQLTYARFYATRRTLIDSIDTSGVSLADLRKDQTPESIQRDPRKIAFEIKYQISRLDSQKDFYPPLETFVIRYSERRDLETACAHYLDVTGLRN
jgi:hypothetical protein